jgi:hypothetical protein
MGRKTDIVWFLCTSYKERTELEGAVNKPYLNLARKLKSVGWRDWDFGSSYIADCFSNGGLSYFLPPDYHRRPIATQHATPPFPLCPHAVSRQDTNEARCFSCQRGTAATSSWPSAMVRSVLWPQNIWRMSTWVPALRDAVLSVPGMEGFRFRT